MPERAGTGDGIIPGPWSHADDPAPEMGGRTVPGGFRIGPDLCADGRPARPRPLPAATMREAAAGFHPDRTMSRGRGGIVPSLDMMLAMRKITRPCSGRIARRAFARAGDAMTATRDRVLQDRDARTRDLGGTLGCRGFGERVARARQRRPRSGDPPMTPLDPAVTPDPARELADELAPRGPLRVTINLGNPVLAQTDPATGEPRGVSVDLARELGRRLGRPVELSTFETAGKAFAALKAGACDLGFLAIDPARAADLTFTPPYVMIEGTYLVPDASPLREVAAVDRAGIRIAAGRNTAYDLHLSRTLEAAELVYAPTSQDALALFARDGLDAAAGVRQPLLAFAGAHPGYRVLEGRFMAIAQAMATPRDRSAAAAAYLRDFIEAMKATGFVAAALTASGQGEATVAPPAEATSPRG